VKPGAGSTSIAARLVLLFMVGSGVIMAGVGYTLYHALRMQLESKELAEVSGKTEVIEHLFRELETPAAFHANLQRFRDVTVGHPHLRIGVSSQGAWLVTPGDDRVVAAAEDVVRTPRLPYAEVAIGGRIWWLRSVAHSWAGAQPLEAVVVLAIDTTENRKLLRDHAAVATLVAVVGTFLSGLLGWFVARRGLAPIAQVAARAGQVTAQRLGARLDLQEAPKEVHGLGESINHMLERLEESFRALEQFSADIAHELRTPLNNLLLQTQVTLSRPRTEAEYQETLHSNLVELERLQRMVADMLFLARADRGMLELALEDVELADEARSVTEYFEAAASERSQSIRIEGRAIVRGDRLMIRRALTNLLSNAVRYSPPGSPIVVEAGSDARGAFAAVSNPAVELPEQELRRLFARFARRDDSRGREVEGVGLGLAIVDSIMKLHRGSVEPESDARHIVFRLRFAGPVPTEA
jgi:two-component system heavy metal sensor histidine kinase CusS